MEDKKRITHEDRVLKHLEIFGSITSLDAINLFGNTRLSATIFNLRKRYIIESVPESSKNRWGDATNYTRYVLKGKIHEEDMDNN